MIKIQEVWQKIVENKTYTAVLLFTVFTLGFLSTYFGLQTGKPKATPLPINTGEDTPPPFEPIRNDEAFNAVLLGAGGDGHSGGKLTDSIIIASINSKEKKAVLVSVPRDLWIPGNYKINASVLNVGAENTKGALQNVTGLKIDKYALIDFGGTVKLIDSLGGVEVDIPKSFTDSFYPVAGKENETCGFSPEKIAEFHQKYSGFQLEKQFTCRYEELSFTKGKIKVDGTTALKLARSRHGDSDFGRSQRQFAILRGILAKLISDGSLERVKETYTSFSKIVKTDLTLQQAMELSKVLGNPNEYKITEIQLTEGNVLNASKSRDGQFILVPKAGINNFTGIRNFISGQ